MLFGSICIIKSNSSEFIQKTFSLRDITKAQMPSNCIFCKIATKSAPADIKYEDEVVVVFTDIKAAATHHYLSIPKEHIENVNSLSTPDHKGLLEKLISDGKKVIQDQGGDLNDLRIGFHLPPFNTVGHLHLHLISPASSMSLLHRTMFRPNTWWFASVEQIQEKLHKLTETSQVNNKL